MGGGGRDPSLRPQGLACSGFGWADAPGGSRLETGATKDGKAGCGKWCSGNLGHYTRMPTAEKVFCPPSGQHTLAKPGAGVAPSRGTWSCSAPPCASARASRLTGEAPAAAGPLQPPPPFRSRSPPSLPSLPAPPLPPLPPSFGSPGLLPALTRAPGRELVGARGLLPEPSSAEPGGSAARPAAAGGAPKRCGRRPGSGLHASAEPRARDRYCAAAPFPDGPSALLVRLCRSSSPGATGNRAPAPAARR